MNNVAIEQPTANGATFAGADLSAAPTAPAVGQPNTGGGGGNQNVNVNQSNGGGGGTEIIIALCGAVVACGGCIAAYFKMKGDSGGGARTVNVEP